MHEPNPDTIPSSPSAPTQARPSVAVVVPATNSPASLARCLEALRRSNDAPDEIVVVEAPSAAGPAQARNVGAQRATSDVVAFVDADVAVHADAVERFRAAFVDEELVAVFGSYDDEPPAPGHVSQFRNLLHHHVHTTSAGPAETFWAGLGAVRREAFLAAGGFDESRYTVPAIEDIELGMRLNAGGARIDLDPSIRGAHLKRWSVTSMARTDVFQRGAPWVRLSLEARRAPTALNLGWRHRLSALAAVAASGAALARRPRAAAAGLGALVALNLPFFALLGRRGGPALAVAGLPLLVLHHLAAAVSVPVGLLQHLRGDRR